MNGDTSEFRTLSRDLGNAGRTALPAVRPAFQTAAELVKRGWQANARATSGSHGKHYPNSITYDTTLLAATVVAEIGPDSSRLQGGMGAGFEFGSRNQPPHLDGSTAIDTLGPQIESVLDAAIVRLIP